MSKNTKQARASRQNGKKSNGPKTEAGKAASSQNAVKHGLYSRTIVIDSPHLKEDPDQYTQLLVQLFQELEPQGIMQTQLVRQIANCFWRKQRLLAAETAFVTSQADDINPEKITRFLLDHYEYDLDDEASATRLKNRVERKVAIRAGLESIPDGHFAQVLLRYERHLDRQLTRTYKLLRNLQRQNQSQSAPVTPESRTNAHGQFTGLSDLEADPVLVAAMSSEPVGQDPRGPDRDSASCVVPGESLDSPGVTPVESEDSTRTTQRVSVGTRHGVSTVAGVSTLAGSKPFGAQDKNGPALQ